MNVVVSGCGEEAQSRDLYICPLIGRRERGSTLLTRPHSSIMVQRARPVWRPYFESLITPAKAP